MKQLQLKTQKGEWNYYNWGSGATLLIALHGFARSGLLFEKLGASIAQKYTVVALDLPFHGQTEWEDTYDTSDIFSFIQVVLQQEQQDHFELMGYSLGGRIVLKLLPQIGHQVSKLHLIAPDGLDTSFAWMVNNTPTGAKNWLARRVENPTQVLQLAQALHKAKLLNRWTIRYLERQLGNEENRHRLFQTWVALKHFNLNLKQVKIELQAFAKPVHLYWGKYDDVVPFGKIVKQLSTLSNIEVHLLEGGHEIVNKRLGERLIKT